MDEKINTISGTFWEEWTIIDDQEEDDNSRLEKTKKNILDSNNLITAEQAREAIEEVEKESLGEAQIHDEESDGVSVISEKDPHEVFIKRHDVNEDSSSRVELPIHITIIACFVAVAVGFGIGFVVTFGKHRIDSRNVEVNQMPLKPLEEPRIVDRDIGVVTAGIINFKTIDDDSDSLGEFLHQEEINTKQTEIPKPMNIRNFENIQTFKHVLDQVKLSLNTLWSMINETGGIDHGNFGCNEIDAINDLIEMENAAEYVISQLGYNEEVSNMKFKENIRSHIEKLVRTFLNDLMRGIRKSLMKIHKDSNKIQRKINKHICLLSNTMTSDLKVSEILQMRNISVEVCKKIPSKKNKKGGPKNNERSEETFHKGQIDKFDEKKSQIQQEKKYIQNEEKVNDVEKNKKYYKKYKGETKRNFVGAHDGEHRDNMRKHIWPSFKTYKYAENKEENEKQKYGPVNPDGQVCYSRSSCSKNLHNDNKIIREDGTEDWQSRRARSRHSQREEFNGFSNHGWLYDRARARESERHGF